MVSGTLSGAGVAQNAVVIKPTYNQTTTSSATDLLINRTQTAVGSGAQLLIDAQVGGASKFSVSNTGIISTATWNGAAIGADYGGTGQTVYAVGDLLYASTTTALSKLADVATGSVLISGGVGTAPSWGALSSLDHGSLGGLTDDDHTQYALLAGRAGGQTLIGGSAASETLTLQSTSHATKGKILFGTSAYDEVNNRLGIGTTSPSSLFHVYGDVNGVLQFTLENNNAGASARTRFLLKHNGNDRALWYTDGANVALQSSGQYTDFYFTSSRNFFFNASNWEWGNIDFKQSTNTVMRIDRYGNVGIGTTSPGAKLEIASTGTNSASTEQSIINGFAYSNITKTSGNVYGINNAISLNGTTAISGNIYSGYNAVNFNNSSSMAGSAVNGLYNAVNNLGSGIVPTAYGNYNLMYRSSTGSFTNAKAVYSRIDAGSDSSQGIGTGSLFYGSVANASHIGTLYGLYLEDVSGAGTAYSIYSAGGQSYFAGNVGIGTTSPTGSLVVQPIANSTSSVQFLNSSGSSVLSVDTTNGLIRAGTGGGAGNNVAIGWSGTAAYNGIWFNTATPSVSNYSFLGNGSNSYFNAPGGIIRFAINNTDKMAINSSGGLSIGSTYNLTDAGANNVIIQGNVGIGTTSPTSRIHGVTTLSAATGDEIAYQLNYTTNKAAGNDTGLVINQTDTLSPGTSKLLDLQVGGVSKFSVAGGGNATAAAFFAAPAFWGNSIKNSTSENGLVIQELDWPSANKTAVTIGGGTWLQTSGTNNVVKIAPIYNQTSGTAANTDLLINRTQTAVGSGAQLLIDAQVGGVSKFSVSNAGVISGIADPLTQYALLAGRAGGQTLIGDTASGGNLTLQSTSHATKGKILFGTSAYDEVNNRLGIGTTGPGAKLDVIAGSAITALGIKMGNNDPSGGAFTLEGLALSTTISNGKAFVFSVSGESYARGMFYSDGSYGIGGGSGARDVYLSRYAANTLRVDSDRAGGLANLLISGNVGIGTTGPGAKLDIKSNADNDSTGGLRLTSGASSNYYAIHYDASGSLRFTKRTSTDAAMVIEQTNGNVGIGTTAPGANLDILNSSATNGLAFNASTTLQQATGNEVAYKLSYATNKATSGADTGLLINMTDTLSPGTSKLLDLQIGGVSYHSFNNTGAFSLGNGILISSTANPRISLGSVTSAGTDFNPVSIANTSTAVSGTIIGLKISPTYNQSGSTAANTDLLIQRTETALGSGAQYLMGLSPSPLF